MLNTPEPVPKEAGTPTLRIRLLEPSDREELREGFYKLSPQSRYQRFHTELFHLSESALDYLSQVDHWKHLALVATVFHPDLDRDIGIGIARFVRLPNEPHVAEAAITVLDEYQGQGIGRKLLKELTKMAIERDVIAFRAWVQPGNESMLHLLASLGVHAKSLDGDSWRFHIPLGSTRVHQGLWARLVADAAKRVETWVRRAMPLNNPEPTEPKASDQKAPSSRAGNHLSLQMLTNG
jgi:GNAT superfamily N-acetyltransferase